MKSLLLVSQNLVSHILVSLFLLAACARPNYVDPSQGRVTEQEAPLEFSKLAVPFKFQWILFPTTENNGSFSIELLKSSPLITTVKNLKVFLWMPSMGHGSVPVQIHQDNPNLFRIERVFFIMRGDWVIHIQVLDTDKKVLDEAQISLMF